MLGVFIFVSCIDALNFSWSGGVVLLSKLKLVINSSVSRIESDSSVLVPSLGLGCFCTFFVERLIDFIFDRFSNNSFFSLYGSVWGHVGSDSCFSDSVNASAFSSCVRRLISTAFSRLMGVVSVLLKRFCFLNVLVDRGVLSVRFPLHDPIPSS